MINKELLGKFQEFLLMHLNVSGILLVVWHASGHHVSFVPSTTMQLTIFMLRRTLCLTLTWPQLFLNMQKSINGSFCNDSDLMPVLYLQEQKENGCRK